MADTPPRSLGTVLVVDDQASNRELVRYALSDQGIDVLVAASGEEALAVFAERQPDCVLLDIRMPGLDGFEVCKRMRDLPGGADTPVVFLTGVRDLETFERAHEAGAVDYLTKPIRPDELLLRVRTALMLRRLSTERTELSELLREQRDDLQRAALVNEQLSAFLVHDLKNPVAGIYAASQLILNDAEVSHRTLELATRIRLEADTVQRMIGNMLDIARGQEGHLTVSRVDVTLPELISTVFGALGLRADTRKVELRSVTEAITVSADQELLRRTLANLVENAIRHAPADTAVTVSTTDSEGGVLVRVTDSGPGVPPELRQIVFDRYVQAQPARSRAGRGLGLAFCRLAVEAHEGRMWIEDADPGAAFCAWFPAG